MMNRYLVLPLLSLLSASTVFAAQIQIPSYTHENNPSCSCSCENRIIFRHDKITFKSLTAWAKEAAVMSLSYGFGNYETALKKASQYYTEQGWNEFTEALRASGNLDIIVRDRLLVKAIPAGQPRVIKQKVVNGQPVWEIELPVLLKYENAEQTIREPMKVSMTVVQTKNKSDVQNLGITQVVIEREAS